MKLILEIEGTREALAMLLMANIVKADLLVAHGIPGEALNEIVHEACRRSGDTRENYWGQFAAVMAASTTVRLITDPPRPPQPAPSSPATTLQEAPPRAGRMPDLHDQANAFIERFAADLDRVTAWCRQTEKEIPSKSRKKIRDAFDIGAQLGLTSIEPETLDKYARALALHLLVTGKVLHENAGSLIDTQG